MHEIYRYALAFRAQFAFIFRPTVLIIFWKLNHRFQRRLNNIGEISLV